MDYLTSADQDLRDAIATEQEVQKRIKATKLEMAKVPFSVSVSLTLL